MKLKLSNSKSGSIVANHSNSIYLLVLEIIGIELKDAHHILEFLRNLVTISIQKLLIFFTSTI